VIRIREIRKQLRTTPGATISGGDAAKALLRTDRGGRELYQTRNRAMKIANFPIS